LRFDVLRVDELACVVWFSVCFVDFGWRGAKLGNGIARGGESWRRTRVGLTARAQVKTCSFALKPSFPVM
jgi:hypothetical protein